MNNIAIKEPPRSFVFLFERSISKKKKFQYSKATLSLNLREGSLRKQQQPQQKTTLCNKIIKDYPLSKSDIVPRNARWILLL